MTDKICLQQNILTPFCGKHCVLQYLALMSSPATKSGDKKVLKWSFVIEESIRQYTLANVISCFSSEMLTAVARRWADGGEIGCTVC